VWFVGKRAAERILGRLTGVVKGGGGSWEIPSKSEGGKKVAAIKREDQLLTHTAAIDAQEDRQWWESWFRGAVVGRFRRKGKRHPIGRLLPKRGGVDRQPKWQRTSQEGRGPTLAFQGKKKN